MSQITLASLGPRFMFLDPSGKRKPGQSLKRIRARTAYGVVAGDAQGHVYVLDAWADKCATTRTVDVGFQLLDRWRPRLFGIEANAMQEAYADLFFAEARRRGIRAPIVEVHQPTTVEKEWRIRTAIQPLWGRGALVIADHLIELKKELFSFPTGQTVDLVDAIASAITLMPPHAKPKADEDRAEADRLAAHLRKIGLAPHLIEDRLRRFREERLIAQRHRR